MVEEPIAKIRELLAKDRKSLTPLEREVVDAVGGGERAFREFRESGVPTRLGVITSFSEASRPSSKEYAAFDAGRSALEKMIKYFSGRGRWPLTRLQVSNMFAIAKRFHPSINDGFGRRVRNICLDFKVKMTPEAENLCSTHDTLNMMRTMKQFRGAFRGMAAAESKKKIRLQKFTYVTSDTPIQLGKRRKPRRPPGR